MLPVWRRAGNETFIVCFRLMTIFFLLSFDFASATTSEASGVKNTVTRSTTTPSTKTSSTHGPPILSASISTCPSRTVNYLTHTLPQKCLKTNWTRQANYTTTLFADQDKIQDFSQSVETSIPSAPGSIISSSTQTVGNNEATIESKILQADISGSSSSSQDAQQSSTTSTIATDSTVPDVEADSPLDNSKFLSFEEWKKQNLEKLGHKPEHAARREIDGKRPGLDGGVDAVGVEGEIDLGVIGSSGAEDGSSSTGPAQDQKHNVPAEKAAPDVPSRRKDAGTTCKERFNYASVDCAATMLKTNSKCKSPSAILVENKDSYMLNECSIDNKFLIVELCDNILIDTVVLANYEFFSSMFRTFRVSVSDRYPVKADRWKVLGTFTARNSRDIQAFAVENPLIWAKYLRVEFLTQYGNEYYCPVSLLRVHGTTMIEDLRPHEDAGKDEDEVEAVIASPVPVPELKESATSDSTSSEQPETTASTSQESLAPVNTKAEQPPAPKEDSRQITTTTTHESSSASLTSSSTISASNTPRSDTQMATSQLSIVTQTSALGKSKSVVSSTSTISSSVSIATVQGSEKTLEPETKVATSSSQLISSPETKSSSQSSVIASSEQKRTPPAEQKAPPSVPHPPAPSPTTQESFFKSVHKRLHVLEANATLSLQYIEEQSRILRDAFTKVEKRQMTKTEDFLRHLNDTVMTELKNFRQQYDQLWQSTVLELETHREQYQREILAVSSRLTILADEVVWQKRMAVAQSFMLLLCLFLVIFGRSGTGHLELPLMQHVLNKSPSRLNFTFESAPGSPSSKEDSSRRNGRSLIRHQSSGISGDEATPRLSRSPSLSPTYDGSLTATPNTDFSPAPSKNDMDLDSSPLMDERVRALRRGERRSRSGPTTPRGTRDVQDPMNWAMQSRKSSFASSKSSRSMDDENDVGSTNEDAHSPPRTTSPTVRFRGSRLANGFGDENALEDDLVVNAEKEKREDG